MITEKRFIIAICGDGKLGIRDLSTLNEYTSERQVADYMNRITDENKQLRKENQRLTNKLNNTALELVDECISQGKATEISEMTYKEFLDFRAKNNKPMELQL